MGVLGGNMSTLSANTYTMSLLTLPIEADKIKGIWKLS